MAERIPGLWEVAPDRWWAVRSIQDKKTIASAAVAGRSMEEEWANAHFIAAAPEMEKALEYVLSKSTIDMDDAMIDVVTAALAKAKGVANA